jgi:hypothetical protein
VQFRPLATSPRPLVSRDDGRVEVYFRTTRTPRPVESIGQMEARIGPHTSQEPEDAFDSLVHAAAERGCDALVAVDVIPHLQIDEEASSPRTNVRVAPDGFALYTIDGYRGMCAVYR